MGQALYRKYRSKSLSEIVGQEHITTTLDNALKKGFISHAYLFTGPRGVGKTSIARILAHEVNGLPYGDSVQLDIIEIDAASNRRIDEIRDLREHIHSAPTSSKYKVYIIDEVHMLTKEAFNALLKTLEEPPEHVIFILATTEAHKLPETIISRTQRYTFKPVEAEAAVRHLAAIAKAEKVKVGDDALRLIAEHGQGSFRDSISLLDQLISGRDEVTLDMVQSLLGIAPNDAIISLISSIGDGDAKKLMLQLHELQINGFHSPQIARQVSKILRDSLLSNALELDLATTKQLLQDLLDVPSSHDPDTLLEIHLLSACLQQTGSAEQVVKPAKEPAVKTTAQAATAKLPKEEKAPEANTPIETTRAAEPTAKESERELEIEPGPSVQLSPEEVILDEGMWQEALNELKKKHNTLYGIARMAVPSFSGNTITLAFKFAFHQKRLDDAKNKKIIGDIVSKLLKTNIEIKCIVDEAPKAHAKKPEKEIKNDLDTISNIFGSAEVLE